MKSLRSRLENNLEKENLHRKNFMRMRDALQHLVSFVQFTKREKHPWRSATFIKSATY